MKTETAYFEPNEPEMTPQPDGRNFRLDCDFRFHDANCIVWLAKSGMITDGASIPQFAWSIIGGPFEGKYRDGAFIHDSGYQNVGDICYLADGTRLRPATRAQVDSMFLEAMLFRDVGWIKAQIMWAAVRSFGWTCWKTNRAKMYRNWRMLIKK